MQKKLTAAIIALSFIFLAFSAFENPEPVTGGSETPSTEVEDGVVKYLIRAGEHYSGRGFRVERRGSISFRAMFDSSAIYQTHIPENQGDINKLYGMSDCSSFHLSNSARFGWRWYNDRLEILAYTYVDGERRWQLIGEAELNAYHDFRILFKNEKYVFKFNDITVEMPRACEDVALGYLLYPYFGGDEKAPHDILVRIDKDF